MKIYNKQNVFDAALDRIRYLFDEFPNIVVGFSGGKDSTVCFNLCMMVAVEKARLPLRIMFIDQEAEWEMVISHTRNIMQRNDVFPMWFQMPIQIFNAVSPIEHWLYCWEDGKEWMREKEGCSIKVNDYGTMRFKELFNKILIKEFENKKACIVGGVRCEESPQRLVGLTSSVTYNWITFGKKIDEKHFIFYPLYDWSYRDIWKAIYDNKWEYCKLYDMMYQHNIPISHMRVSNLHHETALYSLFYLQEFESQTWEKLVKRLGGINTAGILGEDNYYNRNIILPYMFTDWKEYRNYLLENLIIDEKMRDIFKNKFLQLDKVYADITDISILYKTQIQTILCNDFEFTKLQGFECGKPAVAYRKHKTGKPIDSVRGKQFRSFINE